MGNDYYFDARLLRDHALEVQNERRLTRRLVEAVGFTRDYADPMCRQAYNRILNSASELEHYFDKMAEVLDDIALDGEKLILEIQRIIQRDTDQIKNLNAIHTLIL